MLTQSSRPLILVVLIAVHCLTVSQVHAESASKLNVLFIAADDLRNDLACYGDPIAKTPHLDRLAARGVVFRRAYCQQALCNPSRASVMTGRRPDTLGIWDLPTHFREVDPEIVTLPQHFKQHGYFTQNVGKIFHNWRQKIEGDPHSWSVPAMLHYNTHYADKPQGDDPLPPNLASAPKCECRDLPDEAYFDGRVAAAAVEALRESAERDQPFFLAVGFWKPHFPFNAPKRYWDLYRREDIPLPGNPEWPAGADRIAWHNSQELMRNVDGKLMEEAVRELRHGYYAGISYLDAQIGKLLDELDRLELADRTVVVFWSDHGFHLGEHTLWAKTSNFELDARVPLIIAAPEVTHGSQSDALAELLDLYPTLADLCGLSAPSGTEGVSLRPVLEDPATEVKSHALTQHPRPAYYKGTPEAMGYSLRTERYRFTQWVRFDSREVVARELYDHDADPEETVNLANDPAHAATVRQHSEMLAEVLNEPGRTQERSSRPNIVYILADDLGYGDLIKTPRIDALATHGMRFTQHYAGAPSCAPSRCVLMTGKHTGHARIRANSKLPILDEDLTIAEVLQSQGYVTAGCGKWGLGDHDTVGAPWKQGFHEFFGYLDQTHAHTYYPEFLWKNGERFEIPGNRDGGREVYSHDLFADAALDFLRRSADSEQPFFLYLPFTIPHAEVAVPEDSLAAYRGKWPEPKAFPGSKTYCPQDAPRAVRAAMISRLDRDVGRIVDALDELGLSENTLVIFTSDNGPITAGGQDPEFFDSNGPLRGLKFTLYEGGIRVPMIARWPGRIAPGSTSDLPSDFADMFPTFAELAGAPLLDDAEVDGVSIVPTLLSRPSQKMRETFYWEAAPKQALRHGDWKVHRSAPGRPVELYNLAEDVSESRDVANMHPRIAAKLQRMLNQAHVDSADFPLEKPPNSRRRVRRAPQNP